MFYKPLILLFISFFSSMFIFCQTLNRKEIRDLHTTISLFLMDRDKVNEIDTTRKTEFIFFVIDVDSCGKVEGINLLSDEENPGKTASILKEMTAEAFKKIKFEKCKSRTILTPIISFVKGKNLRYIERLVELYPVRNVDIIEERNGLVVIDALRYTAPFSEQ